MDYSGWPWTEEQLPRGYDDKKKHSGGWGAHRVWDAMDLMCETRSPRL